MRLLNTSTVQLIDELKTPIPKSPKYAILSHVWAQEELTFQLMQSETCFQMKGYIKVKAFCKKARSDGFEYAWVDTCCIDKTSSAELSESLNSMFKWYKGAGMCYTFLEDVLNAPKNLEDSEALESEFCKAEWFNRGWCLQELLASEKITFLNTNWDPIGDKLSLATFIATKTGIQDLDKWNDACIAVKFSWMANRKTKREEDMAYSLIGICGVNMVPIYGEGEQRAFLRLQLEILQGSDDESIFAWNDNKDTGKGRGLLAPSLKAFKASKDIVSIVAPAILKTIQLGSTEIKRPGDRSPFAMTNKGLHMEAPVVNHTHISNKDLISKINVKEVGGHVSEVKGLTVLQFSKFENIILLPIFCTIMKEHKTQNWLGIVLRRVKGQSFARIGIRFLEDNEQKIFAKGGIWQDIYIKQYGEEEKPFLGRPEVLCNYGEKFCTLPESEDKNKWFRR